MSLAREAQQHEAAGDIVGALRVYRRMYEANAKDEFAILGIANCALELEQMPIALEFYVRLLILNHDNPWGYLGRANVLFRYGQSDKALSDIASAIANDRPATCLRIDAAALLNANGCSGLAIDVLKPIRNEFSENADFMIELAVAMIRQNDVQSTELAPILEYFSEHRGEDPIYALLLAAADLRKGTESARSECTSLIKQFPDLAEYAEILEIEA